MGNWHIWHQHCPVMRDALWGDALGLWPGNDTLLYSALWRNFRIFMCCINSYCGTKFLLLGISCCFIHIVKWRSPGRTRFHAADNSASRINVANALHWLCYHYPVDLTLVQESGIDPRNPISSSSLLSHKQLCNSLAVSCSYLKADPCV